MNEKFLTLAGNKIRYLDNQSSKQTLVLVHGLGASADRWIPVIPFLESHYRLIIPDLIGFGKSDKPNIEYSIDFFVNFLELFFRELQLSDFNIVGSSLGGQIVAELALKNKNLIKKIVLVSPSGANPRLSPAMKEYSLAVLFPHRDRVIEAFRKMNGSGKNVSKGVIDDFVNRMNEPNSKMVITSVLMSLKDSKPIVNKLENIKNPTLIVWGKDDKVISPRYSKIYASSIPRCNFVLMEGCGHTPFVEEPEEFSNIIIEFFETRYNI